MYYGVEKMERERQKDRRKSMDSMGWRGWEEGKTDRQTASRQNEGETEKIGSCDGENDPERGDSERERESLSRNKRPGKHSVPCPFCEMMVWKMMMQKSSTGLICSRDFGTAGPVVLMLHGFPEIWYSWRYQMEAAAKAGFHAIAPDFRGYGLTEHPLDSDKKSLTDIVDDLVGCLDALNEDKVFVVGKDWGAPVAYLLCSLHPHRVKGVVTLGIPHMPSTFKFYDQLPEGFYVKVFAIPGRAEADFARFDVRTVVRRIYILFCGSELQIAEEGKEVLDLVDESTPLPTWFTEKDLDVYASLYEKSGFGYPLEVPYGMLRRVSGKAGWQLQHTTIDAPALFIMGGKDYILKFPGVEDVIRSGRLKEEVPKLETVFIPEGGHFVQEQFPEEVNKLLIEFLQKQEQQLNS